MTRASQTVATAVVAFVAGAAVDSCLRVYGPPQPAASLVGASATPRPVDPPERVAPGEPGTTAKAVGGPEQRRSAPAREAVPTSGHHLRMPIDGADVESMKGGFAEPRAGHAHEAVDLLAPRNTPVHAVDDGSIAKLFVSKAGGLTIYQFDPTGRLCYYYAHLERYAPSLREGENVRQGDVIGYVGTSGNAPKNTPHLHFAIFELKDSKRWWEGTAIDPYEVFRGLRAKG